MSSEWNKVLLSELVTVKGGKRLPKGSTLQNQKNEHPYIRVRDMGGKYIPSQGLEFVPDEVFPTIQRYIVNENDVIISIVGTVGLVSIIDARISLASLTENAAKLTGLDSKDAHYLYYYLKSDFGAIEISKRVVGAVQPKLPLYNIENIPVIWPGRESRSNIADLFCLLDDKITLAQQINQTLEQMAQALFKSWFVDFEPVKAKMAALEAGGSQEDATLAAMTAISGKDADALAVFEREHPEQYAELQATAELFPSAMQDSELGDIPVTWEMGKLQDLLVLQRGFDLPSSARKDGEFSLIAASGPNGTHNVAMAKAPGVVTGRSGVLGKVYLTLEDYWPLNTTLWVKEFKRATPCYAYELLRLLDMKAFNAGSAVPSLNRNHIHSLSYPLPPMELVNLFESSALLLHQRAHVNLKHSQSLALLRDNLLPKLLSGEITLPEAEQAVSEAENV